MKTFPFAIATALKTFKIWLRTQVELLPARVLRDKVELLSRVSGEDREPVCVQSVLHNTDQTKVNTRAASPSL